MFAELLKIYRRSSNLYKLLTFIKNIVLYEIRMNMRRNFNLLNIPYKICILFISLLFLTNFKIGCAQILLQPEIGTITSINSGTDRIIDMMREEDEENQENIKFDETSDTPKISEPAEVPKNKEVQPIEEKSEDFEIFYPPSNVETFYSPSKYNDHSEKSDSKNANIKITPSKNDDKKTNTIYKQKNNPSKIRIITSAGGGIQKVDTGNGGEIKNHIVGMDIAIVREIKNPSSKLLIGGLVDFNHNKYDNEANGINGSGKSNALTVGIIAKHIGNNGFYYEGSARLGRAKTDFQSNNSMYNTQYEESAPIYAGHTRIGKIIKLNDSNNIDIYGSYSFAHQDRINLRLSSNENYDLGSLNSNRLRAGCRMTTRVNNGKVYYGLAYQYETDAKIKARQNGNEIYSSSGRGNSGLIELGYRISTNKDKTSNIDINAAGFAGRQKGFSIMAQFVKSL